MWLLIHALEAAFGVHCLAFNTVDHQHNKHLTWKPCTWCRSFYWSGLSTSKHVFLPLPINDTRHNRICHGTCVPSQIGRFLVEIYNSPSPQSWLTISLIDVSITLYTIHDTFFALISYATFDSYDICLTHRTVENLAAKLHMMNVAAFLQWNGLLSINFHWNLFLGVRSMRSHWYI